MRNIFKLILSYHLRHFSYIWNGRTLCYFKYWQQIARNCLSRARIMKSSANSMFVICFCCYNIWTAATLALRSSCPSIFQITLHPNQTFWEYKTDLFLHYSSFSSAQHACILVVHAFCLIMDSKQRKKPTFMTWRSLKKNVYV